MNEPQSLHAFFADVSKGALLATIGPALAAEFGITSTLAADDVAVLCRRHEIAFIGGVDEFPAVVGRTVGRGQAGDACTLLRDRLESVRRDHLHTTEAPSRAATMLALSPAGVPP